MSYTVGNWQTATIADEGTTSGEIDLGRPCDYLQVIIPTIDAATIKVTVSDASGGTFVNLGSGVTTVSGTGNYATTFKLGHYQFIKLVTSATQSTSAVSFKVRGMRI